MTRQDGSAFEALVMRSQTVQASTNKETLQ